MQNASIAATALFGVAAYVEYSKRRWILRLKEHRKKYHGYTTTASEEKDVLLVMNPASGGGKSQAIYQQSVDELERNGRLAEVYVTECAEDLMSITQTKDITGYRRLLSLEATLTISEFLQDELQRNDGRWPFAPILHLPGGTGNVISADCHGRNVSIREIVQKATVVRRGAVLKCSVPGSAPKYAIHNAFDGIHRFLLTMWEHFRSTLVAAFDMHVMLVAMLSSLAVIPFRRMNPTFLTVAISDIEGEGTNVNFGVSRFDDKRGSMWILHMKDYKGLGHIFKTIGALTSGNLGGDYQAGKSLDKDLTVKVANTWTIPGDAPYKIFFDGSTQVSLQGRQVTFQVIPDAIPYLSFGQD